MLMLGLITALSACTTKSAYDTPISLAAFSLSKTYTLQNSAKSFDREEDLVFVDSVSMIIPTLIGANDLKPLQDSIFKTAFDSTAIDHQSLAKAYFSKINSELGFVPVERKENVNYIQADGFNVIRGSVINLTPRILVYCVANETMMPLAAHGMQLRTYINYNIENNSIISLKDIFTDDGITKLPEALAKRAEDRVTVFGPTEVEGLPHNGNFFISPTGEIVFTYQPYEIASYAQGFINIAFYPYELISYMTPFGIQFFRLNDLADASISNN